MGAKNKKKLNLTLAAPKPTTPSSQDAQIPGALANDNADPGTLEIGVEFKLDLRNEDLVVLRELGAGNGGTVSKVQHAATKVIMAKKVIVVEAFWSEHKLRLRLGHTRGSEEGGQEADRSRTTHHARLCFSKYCHILWCVFTQFGGCNHVYGIYGLRVSP